MKKFLAGFLIALAFGGAAAAASADVVSTDGGKTFVASPSYCSCVSTIDGHVFVGVPYSPFVRDVFLGLPADTVTAVDLWSDLASRSDYRALPPVTSISTTSTVSGTVPGDDPGGKASPDSYIKG